MSDKTSRIRTAADAGHIGVTESAVVAERPSITGSHAEGDQGFALAQGELALRGEEAARQHEIHRADQQHKHEQESKDNDLRRLCVRVVVGLLVLAFVGAAVFGIAANDVATRQWAQAVFTTLIGGLVGGVAGYMAGKSGA